MQKHESKLKNLKLGKMLELIEDFIETRRKQLSFKLNTISKVTYKNLYQS